MLRDMFSNVDREDIRIKSSGLFQKPLTQAVFGDAFLILSFMEQRGLIELLRRCFPQQKEYRRVLCHLVHSAAMGDCKTPCGDYTAKSFLSYLLQDIPVSSLDADAGYFTFMGREAVKLLFFKGFVALMRETHPNFGKRCYIDAVSLPAGGSDDPYSVLYSEDAATRPILVLDGETGLPVWFQTTGDLDRETVGAMQTRLKKLLDIETGGLALDAGFATKELISQYHLDAAGGAEGEKRLFIGKMPAKRDFPLKALYHQVQALIPDASYEFIRSSHSYFGARLEIALFGKREYAYIYVDKDKALQLGKKWRQDNPETAKKLVFCKKRFFRAPVQRR